jgi:alpha-1,2-mannosyltransferase
VSEARLTALMLLLGGCVAVNLLLWRTGATTSLRYTRMAIAGQASADSWRPMERALEARDRGERIYATVFFRDREKFQYPPSSLLVPLAVRDAADGDLALFRTLNRVGWYATVVLGLCTACLAALTWREGSSRPQLARLMVASGIAGVSVLLFFPATIGYVLGQIQTIVNAAIGVALVCWLTRRESLAGVAIAIAALVKPHFALLFLWGALRRRWHFVAVGAGVFLIGTIAAMAVFGIAEYRDYVRVLEHIGARGEALYANQTVNGLLNRLIQPAEHRGWDFHSYPPSHALVLAGTSVTSLTLVMAALFVPPRLGFAGTPLDLAIAWLSVTVASPIAWDHHYGGLLPILVIGAGAAWAHGPRWTPYALAACAVVTGNLWEPLIDVEAPPWNVVQSYVLAGSLVILGVLYRLGAAEGRSPSGAGYSSADDADDADRDD